MTKGMAANGGQGLYRGEGPLSPPQRATGPCRPWGGRQAPVARWVGYMPLFFCHGPRCEFEEKKITLRACRPMRGRPDDIFEIFQNGHIFLKFLFFKNIKKKKPRLPDRPSTHRHLNGPEMDPHQASQPKRARVLMLRMKPRVSSNLTHSQCTSLQTFKSTSNN